METFLIAGYSLAKTFASFAGLLATLNQRWQAANISGWCFSRPLVTVMKLQTNIPAFQRYWPLFKYSSAFSKFGFSTNCSALKNVVLYFFTPDGGGSSLPKRM